MWDLMMKDKGVGESGVRIGDLMCWERWFVVLYGGRLRW